MDKIGFALLLLFFVSQPTLGDIYKCSDESGGVGFSDKPCVKDESEERVLLKEKKTSWINELVNQKPTTVKIIKVVSKDDEVVIKYSFETPSDSSHFMRLASTLSGKNVSLVKIKSNQAEINVSEKPNPLFAQNAAPRNKPAKSSEGYKHSKCIEEAVNHKQKLTYQEICKYSSGCPEEKSDEKILMYCLRSEINQCFESGAWQTINEVVGVSNTVKVGILSNEFSVINGVKASKTCIYYD